MKDYQVVQSTPVYKGKIIDVVQDTVVMPNGRRAIREIVVHGGAAAIIPIDQNGDIILVEQYRHPARQLVLEIPAGTLEKGEEPLACAERELEEETGFKTGRITFVMKMYSAIGFCTEMLHIYLAEQLTPGSQNLDPDEFVTVRRYSLSEAISMIFSGEIKDSKTIAALLAYKEMISR